MQQLTEFEESLADLTRGNMTLVSELNSVQLAIQGAIRQAFKTPEVIKMFAKREPDSLRAKLDKHREDARLGRISNDTYVALTVEILLALQKLGEPLSSEENQVLRVHHEKRDAYVAHSDDDVATSALSLAAKSAD
ncbi:hypothetical protein CTAYLR_008227 [Chrysophaeum taylorii]|uniref:Beta-catenin-interacting ICAT domain-containing protein n=1 Tax=Chrysophaeum taylorii TaxID=2483200 RepID=A0AAD7UIK4_9STRA|nr:hypothetical protein CTAYLR_008227 [Chrysophaeum taylorii]